MPPLRPLTSIRFLFALLVVLFHGLTVPAERMDGWPHVITAVVNHGSIGVSFFFVLSGFILAYSYRGRIKRPEDYRAFWLARAARVLPAYYLAFLIYLPLALIQIATSPQLQEAVQRGLLIASLQLTLLQAWVPETAVTWNGPSWSLSVETVFYLLFPFMIPLLEKLSRRALIVTAIVAYAASQALAVAVDVVGSDTIASAITQTMGLREISPTAGPLFFTYFPPLRVPEFVFGAAMGMIFLDVPPMRRAWRIPAMCLGLLGVYVTFTYLDGPVPWTAISNGILAPFLTLILFALAYSQSRVWNHPFFVRLGDASYSLYLIHVPVMLWMEKLDAALFNWQTTHLEIFFPAYLVVVIGCSLLSLTFVEEPLRRAIRRKFAPAAERAAPVAV